MLRMLATAPSPLLKEELCNCYELLSECTGTFMLRALASCEKSPLRLRRELTGGGSSWRFMYIIIDRLGHSVRIRGLWWSGVWVSGHMHFPMRVDRLQSLKNGVYRKRQGNRFVNEIV
jgi:hypothetical protein